MEKSVITEILSQIADTYGVSIAEIRREIELAIDAGRANPAPEVQAKWDAVSRKHDKPTPEELIVHIANTVKGAE